jgi:hypothetical protein
MKGIFGAYPLIPNTKQAETHVIHHLHGLVGSSLTRQITLMRHLQEQRHPHIQVVARTCPNAHSGASIFIVRRHAAGI